MRLILYKLFLFLFFVTITKLNAITQKEQYQILEQLSVVTSSYLYNLEYDNIPINVEAMIQGNNNIIAIDIIDDFKGETVYSYYRKKNKVFINKGIPKDIIIDTIKVSKKSIYESTFVGNIIIYFSSSSASSSKDKSIFSSSELLYINNKKKITMCIDPDWMPFEKLENGKHIGISSDYYEIFRKRLAIDIELIPTKSWSESLEFAKQRKCDILSLAMETPSRRKYLNFTSPYFAVPLVIATKQDVPFINNIPSLTDKKIGIEKDYAFYELLKNRYPSLNVVEVKNIKDGLEKVNSGKLFGYVGTLASVAYELQSSFAGELKIAGKFDESSDLRIGVRNDDKILFNIFQKLVKNLSEKQKQKILNDWVSIKYEKGVDYTILIQVLIVVFVIGLFILYRQYILKEANDSLKVIVDEKTKDLKKLNTSLEEKIKEEVDKNLKIQKKLFDSEKMVSMGEMIANIAHQWRQPLAIITMNMNNLLLDIELDDFEEKNFKRYANETAKQTEHLSKTIDDFKNFIKGDKEKSLFSLKDEIGSFLNLVNATLKSNNIKVLLDLKDDIKIDGYENELTQCMINIINNSKDAFKEKVKANRIIFISTSEDDKNIIIKVRDNAAGIDEESLSKIFEPYFTTKHKSQGTGLGLHMVYSMIEGMGGTIEARNVSYDYDGNSYNGAEFTIMLPR